MSSGSKKTSCAPHGTYISGSHNSPPFSLQKKPSGVGCGYGIHVVYFNQIAWKENLMTTIKIKRKRPRILLLLAIALLALTLVSAAWAWTNEQYQAGSLKQDAPIMLQVPPVAQSQATSCGEAVIVMAYNYAYPETPINEAEVIAYATQNGYFTEELEPFTSPANMINITKHYTDEYSSGTVSNASQGLALLIRHLKNDEPVIIDVLTRLDDPTSGAHFVLVTGVARDVNDPTIIWVYYNNPLTGVNEVAPWDGDTGLWHAWMNNPDPGGPGWWLTLWAPDRQ
jgi:hypothetical protein